VARSYRTSLAVSTFLCCALAAAADPTPPVRELDIAGAIVESLNRGRLTEEQLVLYFEENRRLLAQNIRQAQAKHEEEDVGRLVAAAYPRYVEDRALIASNYERFSTVKDQVTERIRDAFGEAIPSVVLVPSLGLYSAAGWADTIDATRHIFVALERFSEEDVAMDILLTHEIVHGISEVDVSTVRGGFYDEGYATYVPSVLYPGRAEESYFFDMDEERYDRYLEWIEQNREQILEDSEEPFVVLDDVHKLYFTTSFSDYPNIAYVIGFKYAEFLNQRYTLAELRTFGMNDSRNREEFREFILNGALERSAPSLP
jgi:hypothetical protein